MSTNKKSFGFAIDAARRGNDNAPLALICVLMFLMCTRSWANSGWQNPINALDVSGDGVLAPDDLLIEANELLRYVDPITKNGELPLVSTAPPFVDSNGDCFLTPIDLLLLINSSSIDSDLWLNGVPQNTVLSPSESAIEFRLSDATGNLVSQTNVGSTVFLTAVLIDDAATSFGTFAAYLDLGFDEGLVSSIDSTFPDSNRFVSEGTPSSGLIAGIGSSTGNLSTLLSQDVGENFGESFQGAPELELFTISFSADEVGVVDFTAANAAALVYGNHDWLSPTLIGTSLTVVPEPKLGWFILLLLGIHQIAAFRHR